MRNKIIASTAIFVVASILVSVFLLNWAVIGALFERVTLPNVGTIKGIGVGVYWDSGCSNQVTSVDWGTVEPGSTKNVTVFIRNEGNVPETLSLETENWNPQNASSYMSLTWDYGGQAINVDEVVQVTLSLSISDTIEGITNFSFDIVIIGTG